MLKYPDTLPMPNLKACKFKKTSNILRTTMDTGMARQRVRFFSVPTTMTAMWRCKGRGIGENGELSEEISEAELFEGFVEYAIEQGVRWFLMNILTPSGMVEHEVRFITDPQEDYAPISALWWEYNAEVEIKKRAVITQEQTVTGLLAPDTLEEFIEGFDLSTYAEDN